MPLKKIDGQREGSRGRLALLLLFLVPWSSALPALFALLECRRRLYGTAVSCHRSWTPDLKIWFETLSAFSNVVGHGQRIIGEVMLIFSKKVSS
jgi:hypothetical protein